MRREKGEKEREREGIVGEDANVMEVQLVVAPNGQSPSGCRQARRPPAADALPGPHPLPACSEESGEATSQANSNARSRVSHGRPAVIRDTAFKNRAVRPALALLLFTFTSYFLLLTSYFSRVALSASKNTCAASATPSSGTRSASPCIEATVSPDRIACGGSRRKSDVVRDMESAGARRDFYHSGHGCL